MEKREPLRSQMLIRRALLTSFCKEPLQEMRLEASLNSYFLLVVLKLWWNWPLSCQRPSSTWRKKVVNGRYDALTSGWLPSSCSGTCSFMFVFNLLFYNLVNLTLSDLFFIKTTSLAWNSIKVDCTHNISLLVRTELRWTKYYRPEFKQIIR